jgi:predicted LPLAT superfamily acyltransferase
MAKRGPRSSTYTALSTTELHAELRRRQKKIGTLERKYQRAIAKADAVADQIAALGGSVQGGAVVLAGRKRPKNDSNLVEALAAVLKGKTMGVTEVSSAVQKAGYKTSSANFRTIVNQALIKHTKVFKKVSRGQYTAS